MENMIINLQDIDISRAEEFAEYADFKEQLKFEMDNRPFSRTYLPTEIKARNEALSNSLRKMDAANLKQKADALIKAQQLDNRYQELINHMAAKQTGSYNQFNAMWSPVLWQSLENRSQAKVSVGSQTMDAFDLDYAIAESLQQLYSEEDPKAEYYDWIERQKQIEVDINTNGTTEEEVATRNTFIAFLDDRETEIKRIISLYSGAAFNPHSRQQTEAQQKLKFLTFKLSELYRLRERTKATKDRADSKEYFAEQERRERQAALAATAGITGIALADEVLSLGERRLKEGINTATLEHGIGESFVRLRPETRTREQAENKINTAMRNRNQMAAMLTAMRNGISKDEWLRQQDKPAVTNDIRQKVRNLHGFRVADYQEYSNSMSA